MKVKGSKDAEEPTSQQEYWLHHFQLFIIASSRAYVLNGKDWLLLWLQLCGNLREFHFLIGIFGIRGVLAFAECFFDKLFEGG